MKRLDHRSVSIDELVERFATVCVEQDKALLWDEHAQFSRLFLQMRQIEQELKSRAGDQRKALLKLYDHPNMQVRLQAAKLTLAVAPEAGRRMLRMIADSHRQPQAGDAGMSLWNLHRGVFVPE
jgi:hypothetical protein